MAERRSRMSRGTRTRSESDYVADEKTEDTKGDDFEKDIEEWESRRGRPRRNSTEESERPTRRAGRRSRDEEDEPREKRERPKVSAGRGWGAVEKQKSASNDFVKFWKYPEEETLIKVLEDEPFLVYAEHWLDDAPGRKKSFVCLESLEDGEDCPICDELGDRAKPYTVFNILTIDFDDHGNVVTKVEALRASRQVTEMLQKFAEDKKTKPLSRQDVYFSVYKTGGGKQGPVKVNISSVKARDLEEDWDVEPFTTEELAEFKKDFVTEEDVLFVNSKRELQAVVDSFDS